MRTRTPTPTLLGVSDVSVGYGSPEVLALMHDLCARAGAGGLLIEPDEPDRPPLSDHPPGIRIERVASDLPPQSTSWRRSYLRAAVEIVDKVRPDVLVVFGGAVFPVLAAARRRPRLVLYHAYEQIADLPEDAIQAHRLFLDDVDLVVTPAVRRLIFDCQRLDVWPRRVVEIYNAADVAYPGPIASRDPGDRNGRFFWSGALHRRRTFADYFLSDQLAPFEIDLFGRISDPGSAELRDELSRRGNLTHHGVVSASELNGARASSIYSLVWWNPRSSFGHLHLASNRFFTAIQAGVPPLCGPHPQCLEIQQRYGCAVVMDDWTLDALARAMRRAMDIYLSDGYAELVQSCRKAAAAALSWPRQFSKIAAAIDGIAAERGFVA